MTEYGLITLKHYVVFASVKQIDEYLYAWHYSLIYKNSHEYYVKISFFAFSFAAIFTATSQETMCVSAIFCKFSTGNHVEVGSIYCLHQS